MNTLEELITPQTPTTEDTIAKASKEILTHARALIGVLKRLQAIPAGPHTVDGATGEAVNLACALARRELRGITAEEKSFALPRQGWDLPPK